MPPEISPLQMRLLAAMLLQLRQRVSFDAIGGVMFYNNLYLKDYKRRNRSRHVQKAIPYFQQVNDELQQFFEELHQASLF